MELTKEKWSYCLTALAKSASAPAQNPLSSIAYSIAPSTSVTSLPSHKEFWADFEAETKVVKPDYIQPDYERTGFDH
jgi:hypothetical protein